MKSTILIKIKWLNRYFNGILIFFIIYNTYFGWNRKPITELEGKFDDVLTTGIALGFGFIIHIILSYIQFKMTKYKTELNKNSKS